MQAIEIHGKNEQAGDSSPACSISAAHIGVASIPANPQKSSGSRCPDCHTSLPHKPGKWLPQRRRPTGLWLRGSVWQFRVRVPQDVRSKIGRSEVSKSLGTSSYRDAIGQARKVAYQIEIMFDQVRCGLPVQMDFARNDDEPAGAAQPIIVDVEKVARIIAEKVVEATPQPEPTTPPIADRTIKQVYDGYMADPSRQFAGKTKIAYDSIYKMLIEVIGENTPIRQLTRERCRGVLNLLRQLPANAAKKYPKLTLMQAAERGSRDGAPTISAGTVNGYIQKLSALLSWSVNEGYLDKNPARGLKVVDISPDHQTAGNQGGRDCCAPEHC